MKFTLTQIPPDMSDYVANENTRNKPVKVYIMLFDEAGQPLPGQTEQDGQRQCSPDE